MSEFYGYVSRYDLLDFSKLEVLVNYNDEDIGFVVVRELKECSENIEEFYAKCIKKIFSGLFCEDEPTDEYEEILCAASKIYISVEDAVVRINSWIEALRLSKGITDFKRVLSEKMIEDCVLIGEDDDFLSIIFSVQGYRYLCFVL